MGKKQLLWEDDSTEAVWWVEDEFNYFWKNPHAETLTKFIEEDIERLVRRKVIYEVVEWKKEEDPAATVVESPVYRQEFGLWEHQKYFIDLAFNAHKKHSARFVLADQVGLGKTVQLALSAQLMALHGDKPVLVIAPKTLLFQWQNELNDLLEVPSAVWTKKGWIDENEILHPAPTSDFILKCPRRIGIISQGLITSGSDICEDLLKIKYECVIVDECHRARRKNLAPGKENYSPDPNNLMKFLLKISEKTKSMLLATATPVQLNPIEAWDLLNILAQGSEHVLGNPFSEWRRSPEKALDLVMGKESIQNNIEGWDWLRNPFPPAEEGNDFAYIRRRLNLSKNSFILSGDTKDKMSAPDKTRISRLISNNFILYHNTFIRNIIRRTRNYLETKLGLYAGGNNSGIFENGAYKRLEREEIKNLVKQRQLKILVGTDAASEGLNLQTLGTLVNLDLPWNPTRLEQRKGRIQRIGQTYEDVWIYNMRYKDSVEDKVHKVLSSRLKNINDLFGQIPDVLEDVWVKVALNEIAEAEKIIDQVPEQHPFEIRNSNVKQINWEKCSTVLDSTEKKKYLMNGW